MPDDKQLKQWVITRRRAQRARKNDCAKCKSGREPTALAQYRTILKVKLPRNVFIDLEEKINNKLTDWLYRLFTFYYYLAHGLAWSFPCLCVCVHARLALPGTDNNIRNRFCLTFSFLPLLRTFFFFSFSCCCLNAAAVLVNDFYRKICIEGRRQRKKKHVNRVQKTTPNSKYSFWSTRACNKEIVIQYSIAAFARNCTDSIRHSARVLRKPNLSTDSGRVRVVAVSNVRYIQVANGRCSRYRTG